MNIYKKHYGKIHFCITGIVIALILVVGLTLFPQYKLIILSCAYGIAIFPYYDWVFFENTHHYRLCANLILACALPILIYLGGLLASLGTFYVCIGFIIPVLIVMFLNLLPGRYKMNSWLFAMFFSTGTGMGSEISKLGSEALYLFFGLLLCCIIYYLYYLIFAKKIQRVKAEFYPSISAVKHVFKNANPRVFRFSLILYISVILAYLCSVMLNHLVPQFYLSSRAYWSPYFVFLILQLNPEKSKLVQRTFHRFLGTLMGLILGTVVVVLIHNPLYVRIVFIVITLILLNAAYDVKNYYRFTVITNSYMMFLYIGILSLTVNIAMFRFAETIISVLISLMAIFILRPIFQRIFPIQE